MNINGRMHVKTLKKEFKKEFGLSMRVYEGKSFAKEDVTLASVRKSDEPIRGEFSPKKNMKIGSFEDKMMELFSIKIQISGSDDSYLCNNDYTLAKALEMDVKRLNKREKTSHESNEVSELPAEIGNLTNLTIEQIDVEDIVEEVCEVLDYIISDNADYFKKEGDFKVRPGYGYDKFYLDWVDGDYDMSLHGLIHYILYENGYYEKFLSEKQLEDVTAVIEKFPEAIYSPDTNDDNYEKVQYEYLDVIYWNSIQFVANKLMEKGFDVEDTFLEYLD